MKYFLIGLIVGSLLVSPLWASPVSSFNCEHPEGEWIATEHYAANLIGELAERVSLYNSPGGERSRNYGLGQDPVIAIAEACIKGSLWRQVKFPAERYGTETIRWIPASLVRLH